MKNDKYEITGESCHCHHYVPVNLGGEGADEFNNLRVLNKFVHILIHATEVQMINKYLDMLQLNPTAIKQVSDYRKESIY